MNNRRFLIDCKLEINDDSHLIWKCLKNNVHLMLKQIFFFEFFIENAIQIIHSEIKFFRNWETRLRKLTRIEILRKKTLIMMLSQIKWFKFFMKHANQIIDNEIKFRYKCSKKWKRKNKRTIECNNFDLFWCEISCD